MEKNSKLAEYFSNLNYFENQILKILFHLQIAAQSIPILVIMKVASW
jgi:hypothetical protein